jgi:hypothetical protein
MKREELPITFEGDEPYDLMWWPTVTLGVVIIVAVIIGMIMLAGYIAGKMQ